MELIHIYKQRPFDYNTSEELQAAIRRGNVNYPTKDRQVSGECLSVMQGVSFHHHCLVNNLIDIKI
jgi:hypothetical protein